MSNGPRIPLVGPEGLLQQLGISEETKPFEFRRQIKRWLTVIKRPDVWPDCPAELSRDGDFLVIMPHKACGIMVPHTAAEYPSARKGVATGKM